MTFKAMSSNIEAKSNNCLTEGTGSNSLICLPNPIISYNMMVCSKLLSNVNAIFQTAVSIFKISDTTSAQLLHSKLPMPSADVPVAKHGTAELMYRIVTPCLLK